MSVKNRIRALELAALSKPGLIKIARFIVAPGKPITGYRCGNVSMVRNPDEREEVFHERCIDSVEWPSENHRHIFKRLEAEE